MKYIIDGFQLLKKTIYGIYPPMTTTFIIYIITSQFNIVFITSNMYTTTKVTVPLRQQVV